MALLDILSHAQGGELYANAGRAVGLPATEAKVAMEALCPAIAIQLRQRAEDEAAFDALLDVIEDGAGDAFLDDSNLIGDAEVAKDGSAILTDIYGSKAAALKAGAALAPGIDKKMLASLMAIAASSVLAALARSQAQPLALTGTQQAAGSSAGGLFGTIVSAVIEGAVKGAVRELTPKPRRRRKSYSTYRRRRTKTRTRRSSRPSLDGLFREILNSIR